MLCFAVLTNGKVMANKTKTMQQIRQILQSHLRGEGIKAIARRTGIQRNTVREYVRRWNASGLDAKAFSALDDSALSRIVFEPLVLSARQAALASYLEEHLKELKRRGMTQQLLWQEYLRAHPDGYQYTQFCEYIGRHRLRQDAVLRFEHRGGEKMLVDFAGGTLCFRDSVSGQDVECQVFVATLPCSGLVYVEAVLSQQLGDFIYCLGRALAYFGGVPACIVCDNLRSAVKKADRYEPQLTEALEQLSLYYNCTVMATRAVKPRDKAHVERHVQIVYEQVYAPLRKEVFFSLAALNAAIGQQTEHLAHRPLQGQGGDSRRSRFEQLDAPALRPLPTTPFELRYTLYAIVHRDYHVWLGYDKHYYSVPFQYIGQRASIAYNSHHVEIYIDNQCVATHSRIRNKGRSTIEAHRPPNHQHYLAQRKMGRQEFLDQATKIGPNCVHILQKIWDNDAFAEQKANSCLGILRLASKFGPERLENACTRAQSAYLPSYIIVRNILYNNLDQVPDPNLEIQPPIPLHHNIRGPMAYA
jgi:transposase